VATNQTGRWDAAKREEIELGLREVAGVREEKVLRIAGDVPGGTRSKASRPSTRQHN